MDDCIFEVYKFLPIEDLINCTLVSKQFYRVSKNEVLWKDNVMDVIKFDGSYYESFKFNYGLERVIYEFDYRGSIKRLYSLISLKPDWFFCIHILPTQLGTLTNLQFLNLANNKLTNIPTQIGNLKNLEGLYLENNKLTSIPSELGNLTNLVTLNLYNNLIENVPMELCKLHKLAYLNLMYNPINTITYELYKLPKLKTIYPNKIEKETL
jgi:hypothetical protein